jgi:diamine N-acetyltransferase
MHGTVTLRTAQSQHAPELMVLARRTYTAAYRQDMTQAALDWHLEPHLSLRQVEEMVEQDVVLLAETAQGVAGFVQFGVWSQDDRATAPDDHAEVRRLYVLAQFQNRGIGAQLLTAALKHPFLAGRSGVCVGVWHSNLAAQRFYARSGVVPVGLTPYLTESGDVAGHDLILRRERTLR